MAGIWRADLLQVTLHPTSASEWTQLTQLKPLGKVQFRPHHDNPHGRGTIGSENILKIHNRISQRCYLAQF